MVEDVFIQEVFYSDLANRDPRESMIFGDVKPNGQQDTFDAK